MKKKILTIIAAVAAMSILSGCCLSHEWADATCTAPKTCTKCGETEGEALAHTWQEATCAAPKTCTKCGETEGEALAHTWQEATCTELAVCSVCGETQGELAPHKWVGFQETSCETCGAEIPEGSIVNGYATFKEVSYQLPASYQLSPVANNLGRFYIDGPTSILLSVYWNSGISKEECYEIYDASMPGLYEDLWIEDVTYGDKEIHRYQFRHSDGYVGYSAVYWAENIFVYIEGISMDQATIDEVFNQALETLEIHQ